MGKQADRPVIIGVGLYSAFKKRYNFRYLHSIRIYVPCGIELLNNLDKFSANISGHKWII